MSEKRDEKKINKSKKKVNGGKETQIQWSLMMTLL